MKKAQGLPINIVVMMILGLVLFGLGMSLFFSLAGSSEELLDDLDSQIRTDINRLQCSGEDWICAPAYTMRNGENRVFHVYVSNRASTSQRYTIRFNNLQDIDTNRRGITNDCGSVIISYPQVNSNILSGYSASYPFQVIASRVQRHPCSFITTVSLINDQEIEVRRSTVLIRVE